MTVSEPRPFLLCVDNDRSVLLTLERQLRPVLEAGAHLELADTGEEALDLFRNLHEQHPAAVAVVVSDLRMPDVAGDELLRRVEALRPGTACILLSGQGEAPAGLPAGTVHLEKPWQPEALLQLVRRALLGTVAKA